MDLILWRHAEAQEGSPDRDRALTQKGEQDASRMALWLKLYIPADIKILVSPARRAEQTANTLDLPYEMREELAPGKSAKNILAAVNWPNSKQPVLIVGHNPALGHIAALVLTGQAGACIIKKSAAWWLTTTSRTGETGLAVLQAVMSPDLQKGRVAVA